VADDTGEHVVHRDDDSIAFLPRRPTLLGSTLVAPVEHREAVVGDFAEDEYAQLQRVVHRVGRAVVAAVPTERLYILSMGSHSGSAHVHWHVAPLPPGVPYEQQQFHALMAEHGSFDPGDAGLTSMAAAIRANLEADSG